MGEAAAALARRYQLIRETTLALASPLTAEDCMVQSMPDASPVKWHLAHTSWFFETFVLAKGLPRYRKFHERFEYLYNSYYHSVGDRPARAERGLLSRPSLQEVRDYRAHVDQAMLRLLDAGAPATPSVLATATLGLHHEQQHQELILTDIKHALWSNPLRPAYRQPPPAGPSELAPESDETAPLRWAVGEAGLVEIGHAETPDRADPASGSFAFDNESPRHSVYLEPHRLATRLVTNREYLDFMKDGGYQRPELWLSDGWEAARAGGWTSPLYWVRSRTSHPDVLAADRESEKAGSGSGWLEFTLHGIRPLRQADPVCHVSYYEADAYARWSGHRLPSEAEWERAAGAVPAQGNLLDTGLLAPSPAPRIDSGSPQQLFGDVWEWTQSPYMAYPGFRADAGALGEYNGKFMANQMVLRGGSCVTPASHIRSSYRNFFPPHTRWQFSGFRLAGDPPLSVAGKEPKHL
jgi:ergothioneine biosynthesis protein EgtB